MYKTDNGERANPIMEILRPQLVRIGNRCYRKNTVLSKAGGQNPEDEIEPGN